MKELIVATNNKGKIKEIKEILEDIELVSLEEAGIEVKVIEDKNSFEENSFKKAIEIWRVIRKDVIADDSGLCIEALEGFPGANTARFLGEDASKHERNNYIIDQMKEIIDKEKRKAKVITCIALVKLDGTSEIFKGELYGYIAQEKRGKNGFGFDEIFELEDGRTLAELQVYEKNLISSRRLALNKLKEYLIKNKEWKNV